MEACFDAERGCRPDGQPTVPCGVLSGRVQCPRHRLTQVSLAVQSPKAWQSQVGDLKSLVELRPSLRLQVWIYERMAV